MMHSSSRRGTNPGGLVSGRPPPAPPISAASSVASTPSTATGRNSVAPPPPLPTGALSSSVSSSVAGSTSGRLPRTNSLTKDGANSSASPTPRNSAAAVAAPLKGHLRGPEHVVSSADANSRPDFPALVTSTQHQSEVSGPPGENKVNFNIFTVYNISPVTVMKPLTNVSQHRLSAGPVSGSPKHSEGKFDARAKLTGMVNSLKAASRLLGVSSGSPVADSLRVDFQIITGHMQGGLELRNIDQGEVKGRAAFMHKIRNVIVSNSYVFILIETNSKLNKDNCDVFVRELSSLDKPKHRFSGHSEEVTCLAVFERDENVFATGSMDKKVLIWHMDRPTQPRVCSGHNMMVTVIEIVTQQEVVCSGSSDASVRIWSLKDGTALNTISGHTGSVRYLATYHDDQVISGCGGGWIKTWKVNGKPMIAHHVSNSVITCIAFFGHLIVAGAADQRVTFLNANNGDTLAVTGHAAPLRTLHIDPVRRLLLSGSDEGLIIVWDYTPFTHPQMYADVTAKLPETKSSGASRYDNPSNRLRPPIPKIVVRPHNSSINSILLQVDNHGKWERVLTASSDHTISIMDFELARNARTFQMSGNVMAVERFKPGWLATCTFVDNKIVFWDAAKMMPKPARMQLPHPTISTFRAFEAPPNNTISLVSIGRDSCLRVWMLNEAGDTIDNRSEYHTPGAIAIASNVRTFAGLGTLIALGCVGSVVPDKVSTLVIVSLPEGKEVGTITNAGATSIHALLFVQAGLLVQLKDGAISLRNGKSGLLFQQILSADDIVLREPRPKGSPKVATMIRNLAKSNSGSHWLFCNGPRVIEYVSVAPNTSAAPQPSQSLEDSANGTIDPLAPPSSSSSDVTKEKPAGEGSTAGEGASPQAAAQSPLAQTHIRQNRAANMGAGTFVSTAVYIEQADMYAAVGCDDGRVLVLNETFQLILEVKYDGDTKLQSEENDLVRRNSISDPRRRRSFVNMATPTAGTGSAGGASLAEVADMTAILSSPQFATLQGPVPGVSTLEVCATARYLMIGYTDGVVLLWDMSQRRTARRYYAFDNVEITGCALFETEHRIVSWASDRLRFDGLERRYETRAELGGGERPLASAGSFVAPNAQP